MATKRVQNVCPHKILKEFVIRKKASRLNNGIPPCAHTWRVFFGRSHVSAKQITWDHLIPMHSCIDLVCGKILKHTVSQGPQVSDSATSWSSCF